MKKLYKGQGIETTFDTENMVPTFTEKMGDHFRCVSDCKKWIGISCSGTGIMYVIRNENR